jgi:hypothetical protein
MLKLGMLKLGMLKLGMLKLGMLKLGMLTNLSYTTNYIRQDPNPPSDTDFMGNIIQTFIGPDGKDLGPGCGVSWVQVGRCYLSVSELF